MDFSTALNIQRMMGFTMVIYLLPCWVCPVLLSSSPLLGGFVPPPYAAHFTKFSSLFRYV